MASKLTSQEMSDLPLRLLADEIEIIVCTTLGILLCVYLIPDFFYTMWNIFWETMLFGMKITIVGISLIYFYFKLVAWPDARAEDVSVEKYSRWKCFLSPIPNAGIRVAELLLKMFHASEKTPAATAADRRNVHFATPERTIIYYEQTDDESDRECSSDTCSSMNISESVHETRQGFRQLLRSKESEPKVEPVLDQPLKVGGRRIPRRARMN